MLKGSTAREKTTTTRQSKPPLQPPQFLLPRRLHRWFLMYTIICGVAVTVVALCDLSSTLQILPPIQPSRLMDWSLRVVQLPAEKLSFCTVEHLLFNNKNNESEQTQQLQSSQSTSKIVLVDPADRGEHEQPQQQPQQWPPPNFDLDLSTEENYAATTPSTAGQGHDNVLPVVDEQLRQELLVGRFAEIRRKLDYSYHRVYTRARQELQDSILTQMLEKTKQVDDDNTSNNNCSSTASDGTRSHKNNNHQEQWIVFTAGVMGAGKTHSIKMLAEKERFPLSSFVWVDPDQMRHCLPEFDVFVRHDAAKAGARTRKESGMMAEILTLAALQQGLPVIVDGSLRDAAWYEEYFRHLRQTYPGIKIAIFHVTAPREAILERAASRARITGRVVPTSLLEQAMVQVPASVKMLKSKADLFIELENAGGDDVELVHPAGMDWSSFKKQWTPSCGNKKSGVVS